MDLNPCFYIFIKTTKILSVYSQLVTISNQEPVTGLKPKNETYVSYPITEHHVAEIKKTHFFLFSFLSLLPPPDVRFPLPNSLSKIEAAKQP